MTWIRYRNVQIDAQPPDGNYFLMIMNYAALAGRMTSPNIGMQLAWAHGRTAMLM